MLKGRSSAYPVQSLERKGTAKEAATEGAAWLPAAVTLATSELLWLPTAATKPSTACARACACAQNDSRGLAGRSDDATGALPSPLPCAAQPLFAASTVGAAAAAGAASTAGATSTVEPASGVGASAVLGASVAVVNDALVCSVA